MTAVWFMVAAAGGGVLRHLVAFTGAGWRATVAVNLIGSFVLGWLVGSDASAEVMMVVGGAACGSLTTFSTFALDATTGGLRHSVVVTVATVVGTVTAAALGHALA